MAQPRIGRADRLAALYAQREAEAAVGFTGQPAVTRLLMAPVPVDTPTPRERPAWSDVQQTAHQLAEALEPLPAALGEIATRINRHCAVAGRDAELRDVVDAVRARTWALSCAVRRLAEAAGRGA
jgi:hypothetical protein